MKVIYCATGKEPEEKEIKNDNRTIQQLVAGYYAFCMLTDNIVLVYNEDGKYYNLKPNCRTRPYGIIAGNFFVCRLGKCEFIDTQKGDWEYLIQRGLIKLIRKAEETAISNGQGKWLMNNNIITQNEREEIK